MSAAAATRISRRRRSEAEARAIRGSDGPPGGIAIPSPAPQLPTMPRILNERPSDAPALPSVDARIFRLMLPFLWPRDDRGLRVRLVVSMTLLCLTAVLNAVVPILFAHAVDRISAPGQAAIAVPVALLLAYGAMQWLAKVFNELRWAMYGPIEQRMQRHMGMAVFRHVHELSLRFHLARRTGQISRVLDNGMRGIRELLFDVVFLILPLFAEIAIICAVLLSAFSPAFAGIIRGDFGALRLLPRDRVGTAAPPPAPRRRRGGGGARQGGGQPAELRDGQVFRQRAPYRRPLRWRASGGRAADRQRHDVAQPDRHPPGLHPGRGADRDDPAGGIEGGRGRHDRRRLRPGQHLPASAHPAAGPAGPALPLDQAVADRCRADADPARPAGGSGRRRRCRHPAEGTGPAAVRERRLRL